MRSRYVFVQNIQKSFLKYFILSLFFFSNPIYALHYIIDEALPLPDFSIVPEKSVGFLYSTSSSPLWKEDQNTKFYLEALKSEMNSGSLSYEKAVQDHKIQNGPQNFIGTKLQRNRWGSQVDLNLEPLNLEDFTVSFKLRFDQMKLSYYFQNPMENEKYTNISDWTLQSQIKIQYSYLGDVSLVLGKPSYISYFTIPTHIQGSWKFPIGSFFTTGVTLGTRIYHQKEIKLWKDEYTQNSSLIPGFYILGHAEFSHGWVGSIQFLHRLYLGYQYGGPIPCIWDVELRFLPWVHLFLRTDYKDDWVQFMPSLRILW